MVMPFKVSDPTSSVRLGLLRRFGFGKFCEAVGCELPEFSHTAQDSLP